MNRSMVKRLIVLALTGLFLTFNQAGLACQKLEKAKAEVSAERKLRQTAFTYQGELKDANGPVNGSYDLKFTLYPAQAGGTPLGSVIHEHQALMNGLFSSKLDFDRAALDVLQAWLEIGVRPSGSAEEYAVLFPRQKLTPVPSAILAKHEQWSLIGGPVGVAETVNSGSLKSDQASSAAAPNGSLGFLAKFAGDSNFVNSVLSDDGLNVRLMVGGGGIVFPDGTRQTTAGPTPGILNAGNISAGQFGSITGGGNYSFPSNLGIGTATPGFRLDVAGQIRSSFGGFVFPDGSVQTTATLKGDKGDPGTPSPWAVGPLGGVYVISNVGIGTTSPNYRLDVAGQIRSSSGGFVFPDGSVQATAALGPPPGFVPAANISAGQFGSTTGGGNYSFPNSLGIGTLTPEASLHVASSGNTALKISGGGSTGGASLLIAPLEKSDVHATIDIPTLGSQLDFRFKNDKSSGRDFDVFGPNFFSNGNVGIGTQGQPAQSRLHVNGAGNEGRLIITADNLGKSFENGFHLGVDTQQHFILGRETIKPITFILNGERVRITPDGNVGIGTTSPGFKLDVNGTIRGANVSPSDMRLKTNIAPIADALDKLQQIRGVSFEWNERSEVLGHSAGQKDIGVIAQEVETVFPELVHTSSTDGYKAVEYSRLTAVLIEAIKELKAENQTLRQRIEALEGKVENR